MQKKILTICAAAVCFVLALGITLYPVISIRYNEHHQSEIHSVYQQEIEEVDNSLMELQWEAAAAYNSTLVPGTQITDAFSKESILEAASDYGELLNLTGNGIMGFVRIPSIQVNLPIYHGTDSHTLESGIGHLLGSSLPIGGPGTHAVLTGHSGMASQKMFSDLPQLAVGDKFYLEVLNETLAYQVDQIRTVLPHETELLEISEGQDLCTLVTCTPIGINSHRLLVRGHRVPYVEAQADAETKEIEAAKGPISTWQRTYLKGILIGLGLTLCMSILAASVCWIRRRYHA